MLEMQSDNFWGIQVAQLKMKISWTKIKLMSQNWRKQIPTIRMKREINYEDKLVISVESANLQHGQIISCAQGADKHSKNYIFIKK